MKEKSELIQEQRAQQRLAPQQVQFVRLLEMNTPEIEDEVRRQLDDNPALGVVVDDSEAQHEQTDTHSADIENIDPDDDPADYQPSLRQWNNDTYVPQIADDAVSLSEYLERQLGELEIPALTRRIAGYIIGNIDDNGYLTRTFNAIADDVSIATGHDITRADVEKAASVVRSLDPPGVCAVDLRDCLLLQINRLKPVTLVSRIAREIVGDYFDLFSKKHYDRLRAQLGVSKENLREAELLIQSLNPKPGSAIAPAASSQRLSQISPDVGVDYEDGRFNVYLIGSLPQLQIEKSFLETDTETDALSDVNQRYKDEMRQAHAFIRLKRDEAEGFINALKQRSGTLLNVTDAIVRLQPEFFKTGEQSTLRPMILKDVAAITGYDLSVISRATSGKYVATASGIYPLKMFFNEAPKADSDTSSHLLQSEIQSIIDNEDKRHPLSDDAICRIMARKGYDIARRTITKYRERLSIPAARLRKKI